MDDHLRTGMLLYNRKLEEQIIMVDGRAWNADGQVRGRGRSVTALYRRYSKDFMSTVRSVSCRFLRAQSTWRLERKNRKQWSCLPFCSVPRSGQQTRAAECTLWEWTWLAKTYMGRLKVRAEVSC